MRRLGLVLLLMAMVGVFRVAPALGSSSSSNASGDIAHGSEKDAHEIAHPGENHGEGHEAPKTYFGIPGWILKLANMILFIVVLVYFAGGPVKGAFAARREAIRRASVEAVERRRKADQLAADIGARLGRIEDELQAIRDRAVQDAERQKREILAAAEREATKIMQTASNEVENRIKRARQELTEHAGQLAAKRAGAILAETMNDQDRARLFQESLAEVAGVQS